MKTRVYEVAKIYGYSSKKFIKEIEELGLDIHSHLTGLSDEEIKAIKEYFDNKDKHQKVVKKPIEVTKKPKHKKEIVEENKIEASPKKENTKKIEKESKRKFDKSVKSAFSFEGTIAKKKRKKYKNKGNVRAIEKNIKEDSGEEIKVIKIQEDITIHDLADKLGVKSSEIIKKIMLKGLMYTINSSINFKLAEEIAMLYDILVEKEEKVEKSFGEKFHLEIDDKEEDLEERCPIITIMGHVDHGKTSLLDTIRKTNVADGEAGGITQKIGAYQIIKNGKKITFIDTPGHEAFTEMRSRGAQVTDIAILVVAADDGIKPQSIEAISHAKEAGVPIIVAINKIDKPDADAQRVKQQLMEHKLIPVEWGGNTEFVEISAKFGKNIDELLENILLTAELMELKGNRHKRAKAIVLESRLDTKMGAVADVLIQEGEIKVGDVIVAGNVYGKVRALIDDHGNRVKSKNISQPVEIIGFNDVPEAGALVYVLKNEQQAKKIVEKIEKERKLKNQNQKKRVTLETLSLELEEQSVKELKLILRGDSNGSVEALKESLNKLSTDEVAVNIIQSMAGAISEGDVKLADASDAIIIGFHVRPTTKAIKEAEKTGVQIKTYNIIYKIIEEIEQSLSGLLDPEYKENYLGRIEIKKVFKVSKVGNIAGCLVVDGKIKKESNIRIVRDGVIIFDGKLESLKRYKDDAKEVISGQECGLNIENFNDIKEGDIVEAYEIEEIKRKLSK